MNRNIATQISPERGVTVRQASSALLGVSSADRYATNLERQISGTTPYNVLLTSGQNFLNGFFTRVALTEVRLPWYMSTITERNNKINLVYRVGLALPVTFTITIIPGWYTPTTLAAELQRAIRAPIVSGGANKPSFTVVYNTAPLAFIFFARSNIVGDTFFFETEDAIPNNANSTGLYEMMNWSFNGGDESAGSGIPTMLSTEFVDIVSSSLTYPQNVKDGDTGKTVRDVVARIYLAKDGVDTDPSLLGSAPFVVYRQFSTPKQIRWDSNLPIGQLQFEFYDDKGFLLQSGYNPISRYEQSLGDWSITLLVSED